MKRPRIEDIDASAVVDPSWENMPRIQKPPRPDRVLGAAPATRANTDSPTSKESIQYAPYGSRPRRLMRRHPFEIYQDQLDELRRFADLEKRNGGPGSMSAMVRELLDRFIAERKKEEGSA
jgi:hypothetical protein